MANLKTKYLGLELKNPLIVASSSMTSTVSKVKSCEDAGAAAVVLKSLFEEQILADANKLTSSADYGAHADAYDFLTGMSESYYMDEYLGLIEEAKAGCDIPIIASLNCVTSENWMEYANRIQKSGADALELNVFIMPSNSKKTGDEHEKVYFDIARKIKNHISIPVALKLGYHFSGMANFLYRLSRENIEGMVLFNRFYRPDVDIEELTMKPAKIFSVEEEMALVLQWIGIMSSEVETDLAATTGIHSGEAVIKQLLVGAKAAQICSVLFKKGLGEIPKFLQFISDWMDNHDFNGIEDFRGKLCKKKFPDASFYDRSQYIKALVNIS